LVCLGGAMHRRERGFLVGIMLKTAMQFLGLVLTVMAGISLGGVHHYALTRPILSDHPLVAVKEGSFS